MILDGGFLMNLVESIATGVADAAKPCLKHHRRMIDLFNSMHTPSEWR